MNRTLDEKETLEACRDHWQWLADHPEKGKEDWPDLDENLCEDCYCCDFLKRTNGDIDCALCPLSGYAWPVAGWPACLKSKESYYDQWSTPHYILTGNRIEDGRDRKELLADKRKHALLMVEACEAALVGGPKRF